MTRRALSTAVAVALLGSAALSACTLRIDADGGSGAIGEWTSQERSVSEVSAVDLRTTGTLTVSVGDTPSLTVSGGERVLEQLTTVVRGDVLEIDLPGSWHNPGALEYDLVLPALSTVTLSGSGTVVGELGSEDAADLRLSGSGRIRLGDVAARDVTVTLDGSGAIDLDGLAADDARVAVAGSGTVTLEGSTDTLAVAIPGSGDVRAADLVAQDAVATIDGSGAAALHATDTLDASIAGSGSLTYRGDPELTRSVSGSGEIRPA